MKLSKADFHLIDNLVSEKLKNLRFSILDLESSVPYISSYDYISEKDVLEKQIYIYTKFRNKILKLMEE